MTALLDLISHVVVLLVSAALSHFGLMSEQAPKPADPHALSVSYSDTAAPTGAEHVPPSR